MAAFANRGALADYLAEALHRTDTASQSPVWIDMATERIGSELRTNANEGLRTLTEISPNIGLYTLPDDFAEMRVAKVTDTNGQLRALTPISPMDTAQLEQQASNAFVYFLQAQNESGGAQLAAYDIRVFPASGQPVTINYWQIPEALVGGASSNPTLLQYPNLYLYASLIEGWNWAQDMQKRDQVAQIYAIELKAANENANKARYGTGMSTPAPARFYNTQPTRAM